MATLRQKLQKKIRSDFGFDVHKKRPNLNDYLQSRKIDLVLDVGANIGQFGHRLRHDGYSGRIISFEPISDVFQQLSAEINSDSNWSARKVALGAKKGVAEINVSENHSMSSLLEQTEIGRRCNLQTEVKRKDEIEVVRLDDIFDEFKSSRVFLKIDTQGFEQQVLEGARNSLREIFGIQLELPIVHLYKDTWEFHSAINYMRDHGFIVSQFHPVNFFGEDPASLLEIDCVFRPINQTDVL